MFFLLVIFASVGASSFVLGRKIGRAARARQAKQAALPPPGDRTPLTLQVGDIVEHLDRDYLVEGALLLSEAPKAARLCRIIDGSLERFVYATTDNEDAWLLEATEPPEGRPNALSTPPMRLEKRWQASTLSTGRMGARAFESELTIYEYAAGDRLLLVLDGPGRVGAFLGSRLMPHAVDILPGRGR